MYVSIAKCLEHVPNRFDLIRVAAQRAWDLSYGAPSTLGKASTGHKPTVVALCELSEGSVPSQKEPFEEDQLFLDDF